MEYKDYKKEINDFLESAETNEIFFILEAVYTCQLQRSLKKNISIDQALLDYHGFLCDEAGHYIRFTVG